MSRSIDGATLWPETKWARVYQKSRQRPSKAETVVDALMKVFDQPLFNWETPRVVVDT